MSGVPAVDYDALAKQSGATSSVPVSTSASGAVDYDALAKQSGATSSVAATSTDTPPPAPGTTGVLGAINKFGEAGAEVATHPLDAAAGFAKGVGDTVSGVSHLLHKIPVVGETLAPEQGISALDKMDESNGVAQAAGKGLEGIAEFASGDELLEGLSKGAKIVALAQKYPLVAKTLELATAHPWLAKMMFEGGKGAVAGGVEGGVKGAQKDQAVAGAKSGAELGGATGAALGAVTGAFEKAPVKLGPPNPYTKIEPAVEARAAKAGLPAGDAGVPKDVATAANKQAIDDAKAATQKNIDQTLQTIANEHANVHGLPAPAAGTATRDVLTESGNNLVNAGKADYKILDKFTDGKFTNVQKELKNAQDELRDEIGKTDSDPTTLEVNVKRAQMKIDQLFDDAVAKGMPKDQAEIAKSKFKAGQATLDVANDVRMANRVRGAEGVRSTDMNVLENRLQARYDSGRLAQAFGGDDQAARNMLTRVHAAREVAQEFESMPPTESQALRELIANHTTTGKLGASTDWVSLRNDFSKLPDRAARFSDVPKVERFINNQAALQRAIKWGVRAAGTVGVLGAGAGEAYHIMH